MKHIILLSIFVTVLYGAATPKSKCVNKIRKMLTKFPTVAQLNMALDDGMTYLYNGFNLSMGETDFSQIVANYTSGGIPGIMSLLENNPQASKYLATVTNAQMTKCMNAATGMASAFGSNFMAPLTKVSNVFLNNLGPLFTQISNTVQTMKTNGRTQTDCINQAYTMVTGYMTADRIKTVLGRVKGALKAKQWTAVRTNLSPFFLWSKYGY